MSRFGNTLAPQVGAARLVARLELRERFFWPQQDGMVRERGAWWLLAELPLRRHRRGYGSHPTGAVVYRWDGHRWAVRGRIARLPEALDIGAYGGWFVSVPLPAGAVGFRIAGSLSHPRAVITNAGGRWHVERR